MQNEIVTQKYLINKYYFDRVLRRKFGHDRDEVTGG
jgi:hypothetical protein